MKPTENFFLIIILSFLFSCGSRQEEVTETKAEMSVSALEESSVVKSVKFMPPEVEKEYEVEEADDSENEIVEKTQVGLKKIIKDGNISVKSNDIGASKSNIDRLLKTSNAYYESEDLQNDDYTISYNLKIRIPAKNFEAFISSIETGKDEIKSKSIHARDVTEEYVDIETRLENKREYLKRYKVLLSKASSVKDILAIEESIRTLQEEIESKEGRLKYLEDQVSFSTLDLHLYFEKEYIYKKPLQDKFIERVKKSLGSGWSSVVDFVLWTIGIWPIIILTIVLVYIIRRVVKKRRDKHKNGTI